ncbi:MAG: cyclic 2,3-diphosphoglycerate synthase [Thermoplasmata archaeon]
MRGPVFHNFNVGFRDQDGYEVVAFTATQIPNIEGRRYPASLAGRLYPEGIPIRPEEELLALIEAHDVDLVVFAYSDVSYDYVGHRSALVHGGGADFLLMGPNRTMLDAEVPVVAVCAVRTGAGKSQTSRRLASLLLERGRKVVVVRHPMPYGNLELQAVQRFASLEDLDRYETTLEEREEYEPHLERGIVVYAGVDYGAILEKAQEEADVILWDGGNNDLPFYRPDLHIVLVDPHRPGQEVSSYPGEANLRRADVVIVNKVQTARPEDVALVRANVDAVNPAAQVIEAASPITVSDPKLVKGKRVLAVDDGPTLTHGGMPYGAAWLAAKQYGAASVVDPRPHAVGTIKEVFERYPHLEEVLPAMGYGEDQLKELEATINACECDLILSGTPVDLGRLIRVNQPLLRVRYELQEIGRPTLDEILDAFLAA